MRLLDFGSLLTALSIVEWVVLAALVVLFGKRALVVANEDFALAYGRIRRRSHRTALFVLVTVAFVAATH